MLVILFQLTLYFFLAPFRYYHPREQRGLCICFKYIFLETLDTLCYNKIKTDARGEKKYDVVTSAKPLRRVYK